jgi:hypothetical protein
MRYPLLSSEPAPGPRPSEQTNRYDGTAARWIFVILAVSLLPIFVLASLDFGVTWDEKARHRYGEMIWEYLRGLRSRSSFADYGGNSYSGLFDTLCAAVEQWLPWNRYVIRHAINAIFGWIGVVFCGRLAARLFGTWAGVLAMTLLAASPRYLADSMNNPKDLPFAAMTVVALYYFSTISPSWPYLSRASAIKIAVALALALNVRAAALIYVGYLGLLVMAFAIAERNLNWRRLARTAATLAAVVAAVLLLGTVFWPWAQGAPLTRPFRALLRASDYSWTGHVLFNGRGYSAPDLPWYYPLWWFLISTPPVVIAGAILSAVAPGDRGRSLRTTTLWAIAAFPVLLVIAKDSTIYDGVRHLLFIYPILVVLAAAGWAAWLSEPSRPWVRRSAAGVLVVGLVNVVVFNVRFHPNETVYFNELVGGPRGAFAKYDMDYWGNCVLEAVAWSAERARLSGRALTISGNPWHLVQLDAERFHEVSFAPPDRPHHLAVHLNRGPAEAVGALANRDDALYRVQTPDGAVLCVVVPGPAFAELQHLALPPGFRHRPGDAWPLDFGAAGDR